jgi:diguanylate cyclase (GGDEF)-like protein
MSSGIRVEGQKESISVTLSLGVSVFSGGESASSLIKKADDHLYAAKQSGRSRVVSDTLT